MAARSVPGTKVRRDTFAGQADAVFSVRFPETGRRWTPRATSSSASTAAREPGPERTRSLRIGGRGPEGCARRPDSPDRGGGGLGRYVPRTRASRTRADRRATTPSRCARDACAPGRYASPSCPMCTHPRSWAGQRAISSEASLVVELRKDGLLIHWPALHRDVLIHQDRLARIFSGPFSCTDF